MPDVMRFPGASSSSTPAQKKPKRRPRSWSRTTRYVYHRFVRMEGSPHAIARGLAAGVFAGWFPWFGIQMIAALIFATLCRGNKIVAATSTWVSNPLTYVPIYAFNFQVGCWLLNSDMDASVFATITSWDDAVALGQDFVVALLLGCLVVGLTVAAISYAAGLWLLQTVRQRRLERRRRTRLP